MGSRQFESATEYASASSFLKISLQRRKGACWSGGFVVLWGAHREAANCQPCGAWGTGRECVWPSQTHAIRHVTASEISWIRMQRESLGLGAVVLRCLRIVLLSWACLDDDSGVRYQCSQTSLTTPTSFYASCRIMSYRQKLRQTNRVDNKIPPSVLPMFTSLTLFRKGQ